MRHSVAVAVVWLQDVESYPDVTPYLYVYVYVHVYIAWY